jgi:hypothetical protein
LLTPRTRHGRALRGSEAPRGPVLEDPNVDVYKRRHAWSLKRLLGQQLLERALSDEETAALNGHAELSVPVSRLANAMEEFMGECVPAERADVRRTFFGHANSTTDPFKMFCHIVHESFGISTSRLSTHSKRRNWGVARMSSSEIRDVLDRYKPWSNCCPFELDDVEA